MTQLPKPRSGAWAKNTPPPQEMLQRAWVSLSRVLTPRDTDVAAETCQGRISDLRQTSTAEDTPSRDEPAANPAPHETVGSSPSSWPNAFLDDFESRIWMTYRSNFPPIPRNNTPEATSSMTLGVRLRSQLMDSQGFTSDTGWGCMIRSGQSLLANTLSVIQLGRGEYPYA